MRRRELIAAVAASSVLSAALSRFAEVRAASVVIGLLSPFSRAETEPWHGAFRLELHKLGWTEGDNVRFEYRYADGRAERLPEIVADLLTLKPDVIVTAVTTDTVPAAKATMTIPIVMASPGDPVATGLISSLAHPGGNITGLTQVATDLAAKRVQLLKEMAPGISRLAVLRDPRDPVAELTWRDLQEPAQRLGVTLHSVAVHSGAELDAALALALEAGSDALLPLPTPIFVVAEQRIADFARITCLPSITYRSTCAPAGCRPTVRIAPTCSGVPRSMSTRY
jgi:putative ABC transport system substrate-binding protein